MWLKWTKEVDSVKFLDTTQWEEEETAVLLKYKILFLHALAFHDSNRSQYKEKRSEQEEKLLKNQEELKVLFENIDLEKRKEKNETEAQ